MGPARWVDKYVRIPFVQRGFDFAGCHCWGLVWLVYRNERRITLPKYDTINAAQIRAMLKAKDKEIASGSWVPVEKPLREFDVVIMAGLDKDENGKVVGTVERHVGIMASPYHILHIEEGINATCVRTNATLMRERMRKVYRYVATS
jgi:cell wall-associated NlpC family hydrolase